MTEKGLFDCSFSFVATRLDVSVEKKMVPGVYLTKILIGQRTREKANYRDGTKYKLEKVVNQVRVKMVFIGGRTHTTVSPLPHSPRWPPLTLFLRAWARWLLVFTLSHSVNMTFLNLFLVWSLSVPIHSDHNHYLIMQCGESVRRFRHSVILPCPHGTCGATHLFRLCQGQGSVPCLSSVWSAHFVSRVCLGTVLKHYEIL